MFVCCECCVLSGRGLCDGLITRPEEWYRLWCVVVRDQETSKTRRLKPATGLWKIQPQWVVTPGKQTTNTHSMIAHLRMILLLKYALFWDVTQRMLVVVYRSTRTSYRSHIQQSNSPRSAWALMMGPTSCPETSLTYYHSNSRNNPERRRSHLQRGASLKSRIYFYSPNKLKKRSYNLTTPFAVMTKFYRKHNVTWE
jgi:hypothetical protein